MRQQLMKLATLVQPLDITALHTGHVGIGSISDTGTTVTVMSLGFLTANCHSP